MGGVDPILGDLAEAAEEDGRVEAAAEASAVLAEEGAASAGAAQARAGKDADEGISRKTRAQSNR